MKTVFSTIWVLKIKVFMNIRLPCYNLGRNLGYYLTLFSVYYIKILSKRFNKKKTGEITLYEVVSGKI